MKSHTYLSQSIDVSIDRESQMNILNLYILRHDKVAQNILDQKDFTKK